MDVSRNSRRVALTAAVLLLALAGCSSSGSGASSTPSVTASAPVSASASAGGSAATGSQIVIEGFAYAPTTLTVGPGQKVTVLNHDSTAHTLTASDKSFDTGSIGPGKSGSFTAPAKPGSYPYICTIHQFMHGTLTVR
ncbi:cupredoxin domain-containing protein [Streptacidiphilus sp. N1-3]|uniref:Cupredoxin domain-containing protein n=1 Tax=Streptacidiphilus alkalitolerans TaxID=3342712 RepID=A0ABV6XDD7_9ACTN